MVNKAPFFVRARYAGAGRDGGESRRRASLCIGAERREIVVAVSEFG
jgi:hypothetical protein